MSVLTIDAVHIKEYLHTGYKAIQLNLFLGDEEGLLDDENLRKNFITRKISSFFRTVYHPSVSKNCNLFLPPQISPYDALRALDDLKSSKTAYTDTEKYIEKHEGILILDVSDVFYNRGEKGWMAQIWMIDTRHPEYLTGPDFFIDRQTSTEDAAGKTDQEEDISALPGTEEKYLVYSKNDSSSDSSVETITNPLSSDLILEDEDGFFLGFLKPGESIDIERP